ncbi:MAG: hypothetical protein ACFCA4_06025 [Cyanophyceae cyanobacterium]|mgnify:CR=1 FL=1
MFADQPTSINVVGPKRIGKSSLLRHVVRTYEERAPEWNRKAQGFVVVYIDFDKTSCQTQAGFYGAIAKELLAAAEKKQSWKKFQNEQKQKLEASLKVTPFNGGAFEEALKVWKEHEILPVLCLDRFERLLDYPDEFPKGFYDGWRSLMDDGGVMLLIASRQALTVYSRQAKITSSFFNLGHTLRLKKFSPKEAKKVSQLPAESDPVLSLERQVLMVQWGKNQPFCLQFAGLCLFEAQQQKRSNQWARQKFQDEMNSRRAGVGETGKLMVFGLVDVLGWLRGSPGEKKDERRRKGIMALLGLLATGLGTTALGKMVDMPALMEFLKLPQVEQSETEPSESPDPEPKR